VDVWQVHVCRHERHPTQSNTRDSALQSLRPQARNAMGSTSSSPQSNKDPFHTAAASSTPPIGLGHAHPNKRIHAHRMPYYDTSGAASTPSISAPPPNSAPISHTPRSFPILSAFLTFLLIPFITNIILLVCAKTFTSSRILFAVVKVSVSPLSSAAMATERSMDSM